MTSRRVAAAVLVATTTCACAKLFGAEEVTVVAATDGGGSLDAADVDALAALEGGADARPMDAGGGGCPAGMAEVPGPADASAYCIDTTEVTETAYADFVAKAGAATPANQPPECAWNNTFVPGGGSPAAGSVLPVRGVDWCDAVAFCTYKGKHLCGAVGGGAILYASSVTFDAERGQWFRACSRGGTRSYPYGDAYQAQACRGVDITPTPTGPRAVGESSGCAGGYPGLVDMSGNVQEWLDSCTTEHFLPSCEAGTQCDFCRTGGGAYDNNAQQLRCDTGDQITRGSHLADLGLRCCAEL